MLFRSIPPDKSMLLQHMVLSHHGEPDFGAAVRPAFLEAELLSELDLMDAMIQTDYCLFR